MPEGQQLLDRARLSPLVLMIESSNPADQKFARKLLQTFSESSPQASRDLALWRRSMRISPQRSNSISPVAQAQDPN